MGELRRGEQRENNWEPPARRRRGLTQGEDKERSVWVLQDAWLPAEAEDRTNRSSV
jgi:hypothetical protein